jgi:putative FmdB family regulatory protein
MPTYEYRCKDCDHRFDIQQAFTDDALTTCPECGGTLKKVFGNVGITFKGSGFYKTDSRSGSSDKSTSSSDKSSSSSDKSSSSSDKSTSSSDKSTSSSTPATTSS